MKTTTIAKFQLKHIDTGFYRLTAAQAKALSIDGELPRDGYEKRAKPIDELNGLVDLLYSPRFVTGPKWVKRDRPIGPNAQCWIKRTALSWHGGTQVNNGWVWAIHIYE